MWRIWRKYIKSAAVSKLVRKISVWRFWCQGTERSVRQVEFHDQEILTSLNLTGVRQHARLVRLNISKSSVENHLKQLGYTNKLDIWVPYEFVEIILIQRITECDNLLKREKNEPFLKRMITRIRNGLITTKKQCSRDELSQSNSKAGIHWRKILLLIWWISKALYIWNFFQKTKRLIRKYIVCNLMN